MELFFRDDHAADEPRRVETSPEERDMVCRVLAGTHPDVACDPSGIERIAGPSIGSASYRVGDHYVKILHRRPSNDHVRSIGTVAAALRAAGVPIEEPVPDLRGDAFSEIGLPDGSSGYVYVQRFVEGGFFSGSADQLEACLPAILAIGPALRMLAPTDQQLAAYGSWDPVAILARVRRAIEARTAAGLVDTFDQLAREYLPLHTSIAAAYRPERHRSSTLNHLDLHPHNLLFGSTRLRAILDFGGFQAVRDETAIAFALYKLGRKGVSVDRLTTKDFRRLAGRGCDLIQLAAFARVEVTRRATLVLRGHYVDGNTEWDRDARKQLVGPLEVDALFLG